MAATTMAGEGASSARGSMIGREAMATTPEGVRTGDSASITLSETWTIGVPSAAIASSVVAWVVAMSPRTATSSTGRPTA